jgi:methylated-DNA-[protein]-cysteine S-methyltransferase
MATIEPRWRVIMNETSVVLDHIETPIGRLALVADDEGRLHAAGWTDGHPRMARLLMRARDGAPPANLGALRAAFAAYFSGELSVLDALPVSFEGGTPFQQAVWNALREIRRGETRSYADVARRIGNPAAVRAVGLAVGANPIAVAVPCHRVIGSDGSLTGYAAGIERKRWLLAHERCAEVGQQLSLQ